MPLSEIVRMALTAVGAHKLRSFLTMSGIAIGVFSVIGVMTVIATIQKSIESNLNVLGANSFVISKYPAVMGGGPHNRFTNRRDVSLEQAERFRELMEETKAVVGLMIRRGGRQAVYLDRKTNPNNTLIGTDEHFTSVRDFQIDRGRNLTREDTTYGRSVCVLGADLVARLFPGEDPLLKRIRMDGQTYLVVGTFAAKGSMFGQSQDNLVVLPITRFLAVYGRAGRSIGISVQARSQADLDTTFNHAIGAMRLARGLDPEDPNDFDIVSNDSLIEMFNSATDKIKQGAFVISLFALLAAGVGIMNIMLVSVTERTKEIGVRKSLGARRRAILRQFLIEAIVISLLGGVAGIILGVGAGNLLGMFMTGEATIPLLWIVIGLVFCAGIGIVFGYYPARKAARLDPIEALRFE
ncbi:MAG: ABC transporter permease [Opitutaceae bacterium]|nr:ABC transporter permease [Opitutaceae bacterium]